jgi:hypothetical protein
MTLVGPDAALAHVRASESDLRAAGKLPGSLGSRPATRSGPATSSWCLLPIPPPNPLERPHAIPRPGATPREVPGGCSRTAGTTTGHPSTGRHPARGAWWLLQDRWNDHRPSLDRALPRERCLVAEVRPGRHPGRRGTTVSAPCADRSAARPPPARPSRCPSAARGRSAGCREAGGHPPGQPGRLGHQRGVADQGHRQGARVGQHVERHRHVAGVDGHRHDRDHLGTGHAHP